MTQTEKNPDRGNFVQFPCHLIYTCSDLTRDDKWVLMAIMGVCWTEGPYRLSYRDIAALAGVAPSLLSSIPEKNGKPAKEGIMARLQRLDYIRCVLAKDVHVATGKPKGNAQTYIYVNHTKIWGENAGYKVAPHSTRENLQPVLHTNRRVLDTVTPVLDENKPVLHTNAPVLDASTKTPPYITKDITDTIDSERVSSVSADAENATPSPVFSAESLASEETQPDQQQEAKAHPIATETPPQPSEIPVQKPAKRTKKKPATPPALPGRPDPADPWNVEKCLAWGNYFRGFAYPHSERSNSKSYQERAGAQSILLRGKTERQFVDLMCFMRGVTVELEPETNANKKADWWPDNQPAEVRHANEQWDKMSAEYKRKNSGLSLVPPAQPGGVVTPLPGYSDPAKEAAFAALQQQIREEDARKRQQRMAR